VGWPIDRSSCYLKKSVLKLTDHTVYTEVLFVSQPMFKLKDYPLSAVCGHLLHLQLPSVSRTMNNPRTSHAVLKFCILYINVMRKFAICACDFKFVLTLYSMHLD
jgi:hypothetical protein